MYSNSNWLLYNGYNINNHENNKIVSKLVAEQIEKLEDIGLIWELPHPSSMEYWNWKFAGKKHLRIKNKLKIADNLIQIYNVFLHS